MSYCWACRSQLPDDARYCPKCGMPLQSAFGTLSSGASADPPPPPSVMAPAPGDAKPSTGWRGRDYAAVIGAGVVTVLSIVGLVMIFGLGLSHESARTSGAQNQRLTWQKAHPKEYAAQLSIERARQVRAAAAERRAVQARQQAMRPDTTEVGNRLSYLCQHAHNANLDECRYGYHDMVSGGNRAFCTAYVQRTGPVPDINDESDEAQQQDKTYEDLMNSTLDNLKALCIEAYKGVGREEHRSTKVPHIGLEIFHPVTGGTLNISNTDEK